MYKKYAAKADRKKYVLTGLTFLGAIALTVWLTYFIALRQLNVQIAHQSLPIRHGITHLLEEMRKTAHQAQDWAGQACDRQMEIRLNAVPTQKMRLLAVNLLEGNRVYCSSLLDNRGDRVDLQTFSARGVKIDDTAGSAWIPAFSLYRPSPGGGVVVSADLRNLQGILGSDNSDERFALLVNGNLLTKNGIQKGHQAREQVRAYQQHDTAGLYTLVWRAPATHEIWQEVLNSWLYLLLIVTLPLVLTSLVWLLLTRRRSLYQNLINAVYHDRVLPYYQPLICAHSSRVIGAEVLARWHHPEIGDVPPNIFIPVAEKTQTIGQMTENLLNRVLADCQRPGHRLPEGFIFNVNISHSHLSSPDFAAFTREFATRFAALGLGLTFEFTENEQIDLNGDTLDKMAIIRESGIAIALDDFGTGFSNLSWITSLNPDSIKIDRMFINQISPDASTPLINCVIDMAKQMGIKTVAEGVEHDYQVSWLQENNIDLFQGYFYSKPLTFAAFLDYISHKGVGRLSPSAIPCSC